MKFSQGKIVNLVQGSKEWQDLRAKRFTASEAPAALGKSKYTTRNDLLKQKATGLTPEISSHQQKIFDKGHVAEAAARVIAEKLIADDLFPVVMDDEEGGFLASMDGLDMIGAVGWEHKLASENLFAQIDAGKLDEHYMIQLDQQFALSGAEKILFTASDGTEENFKYLWIDRDQSRFAAVEAGWTQFASDLADYVPTEPGQPKAEGKAPEALPALSVQVQGMVTASNLKAFEESARATLANINTDLQTDTDFVNAEKAVKFCKDVESRLDSAKENVLGQMQTVDEVVRSIDSIKEKTRQIRLKLDKAVKEQKESRKMEILQSAKQDYDTFLRSLDVGQYMPLVMPDFAGAMKGKRTISSLKDACDDLMAQSKIEANEMAGAIRKNLTLLQDHEDYRFLFSDFTQICEKPADDFDAIVKSRIADHKESEQKRLDAEREKIRQEEEAKANKAAEEKAKAEPIADEKARREEDVTDKAAQERKQTKAESAPKTAPREPSTSEIIAVLCQHYGADRGTVIGWLNNIHIQEKAT